MAERVYHGENKVLGKMLGAGFTSRQADALVDSGQVVRPGDVEYVIDEELTGAGFDKNEIKEIRSAFRPSLLERIRR